MWEEVKTDDPPWVTRLAVPGGWIYHIRHFHADKSGQMVFVPDPVGQDTTYDIGYDRGFNDALHGYAPRQSPIKP